MNGKKDVIPVEIEAKDTQALENRMKAYAECLKKAKGEK